MQSVISLDTGLKLFLVERTDSHGYDACLGFVVCCATKQQARATQPGSPSEWPQNPDHIEVTLVGTACPSTKPGIVLSSYLHG